LRKLTLVLALALLAITASAVASTTPTPADKAAAVKQCSTERNAMGAAPFKLLYGTNANKSNAFGKCVSKLAQQNAKNGATAASQCRAERDADAAAFASKYGTGKKHANAFGRCVSRLERAGQGDDQNAAQQCKAEQADPTFLVGHGGKTFADFYGRNADRSDAYGRCVSTKAKAAADERQQATLNAAQTCKGERAANPPAFRAKYGKNTDKSDAFGRCVSQHAQA
jgi:hypothetical protein